MAGPNLSKAPVERFSGREAFYQRYRPSYPEAVVRHISKQTDGRDIAEIGSGTGIFSKLLLEAGFSVFAVEPNREMRSAAEGLLHDVPGFNSIDGRAEATGLAALSLDAAVFAQAFHWCEPERTRIECIRILRGPGLVYVVFNVRNDVKPGLMQKHESLLARFGSDYGEVNHRKSYSSFDKFFNEDGYQSFVEPNPHRVDLETFCGRALSASYMPEPGTVAAEEAKREFEALFHSYQSGGFVTLEYETQVFWGNVK